MNIQELNQEFTDETINELFPVPQGQNGWAKWEWLIVDPVVEKTGDCIRNSKEWSNDDKLNFCTLADTQIKFAGYMVKIWICARSGEKYDVLLVKLI